VCKQGKTSPLVVLGNDNKAKIADIDSCIFDLVKCLNSAGFKTKACCCGHGKKWGNIALMDGRELIIAQNYDVARSIDKFLENDNLV
jgi:hypothetical protein